MTETPEEPVNVEMSEEADMIVVDPDDYQKTKKIQTIHRTKKRVLELREDRNKLIRENHQTYGTDGIKTYQNTLARQVAQYGSELLPIIEESLSNGAISDEDLKVDCMYPKREIDIRQFIRFDGRVASTDQDSLEKIKESDTLEIYRQLSRIQRRLGLGLEIEEDKGPAEI